LDKRFPVSSRIYLLILQKGLRFPPQASGIYQLGCLFWVKPARIILTDLDFDYNVFFEKIKADTTG
jgi:hypothetical protein